MTNCVLREQDKVLLLQKPSRGWWVAPGGKMEPQETITEALIREYHEETGLVLQDPTLRGVFTFIVQSDQVIQEEWMMFTFYTEKFAGDLLEESSEGILDWVSVDQINQLPMAEGDQQFLIPILQDTSFIVGKFRYSPEYKLLSSEIETYPLIVWPTHLKG